MWLLPVAPPDRSVLCSRVLAAAPFCSRMLRLTWTDGSVEEAGEWW